MIYFVKAKGSAYIKIGYSSDVPARIRQLQTSHPKKLMVQAILPGGYQTEVGIHELFGHLRTKGEWFRLSDELSYFLRAIRRFPSESNIYVLYRASLQMRLKDKAKRLSAAGNDKLRRKIEIASMKLHKAS